jgi:epidermal growth factor receptor substrate 15
MYFIQRTLDGSLKQLPTKLPPGFYPDTASKMPAAPHVVPRATSPLPMPSAPATMPRYFTGGSDRSATLGRQLSGDAIRSSPFAIDSIENDDWDIPADQRMRFNLYFDQLDATRRGFVNGDEAARFFLESKLPESVLAHIWNLSDIDNDGRLTRVEFILAMYLIHLKLRGQPLPQTLPENLIPPSMRTQAAPTPGPFDVGLLSGSATMPARRTSALPLSDPFGLDNNAFLHDAPRQSPHVLPHQTTQPTPLKPTPSHYQNALMDLFTPPSDTPPTSLDKRKFDSI